MRYEHPELRALDLVEDLLEAYADARLAPAGPVLARMRTNVMAQAATLAAIQRAETDAAAPRRRFTFALPNLHVPRRAAALGLAASFTFATGAAVLAAPPGSPFYNARLVIETAMLPPVSQLDARLAAYEEHLVDRIAEAEAAAVRGDATALAAALAAYQADVDKIVAESGIDADKLAHLQATLAKHTDVLEALAATVPEQASVDRAIDTSQKAIQKIKDKASNAGNPGGPNNNPGGRPSNPPGGPRDRGQGGQGGQQVPNSR